MHDLQVILRKAAFRMHLAHLLAGAAYCVAGILILLLLARLTERALGLDWSWRQIAYISLGVAALGAIIWAIIQRPSQASVARRVDEGANLKESISTALSVAPQQATDPWAKVTVDSAVRIARGINVSHAVPVQPPKFWPVVLALGLAFALVFIAMPRLDMLGWHAKQVAVKNNETQIVQAKRDITEATKKLDELTSKLGLEKEKTEPLPGDKPEARTPEELKNLALKDLTKLQDRLEQLRTGEKGQKLDAISQQLKQLKTPGKETSELSKSMANSNFQQAQKDLEKLGEQMKAGELSAEQKQQVAEQMENLSKQLEDIAKNKDQLAKQLEQAGLDPKAAGDPEALKKALEQAQNLSAEQKSQLSEMAQALSQSQSAMDKLSQAASQMADAAKNGDQQAQQQAAQQMQQQLQQLEQLKQEMDLAQAAQNECKNKMAQLGDKDGQCKGGDKNGDGQGQNQGQGNQNKPWSQGWSMSQGSGSRGGPGLGKGGGSSAESADFDTQKRKSIGALGKGPIVSTRLVEGDSIKGESKAEFVNVATQAEQGASDAIEQNTIPREYHDAIKNYFGTLKSGKPAGAQPPAAPATPAPAAPAAAADAAKPAESDAKK